MDHLAETADAPEALAGAEELARGHERQYELLFEMTTQLLAAQTVEERLLLTLDAVTSGLGHPHAAVALIDKHNATLNVRRAAGFDDDERVAGLVMPLDGSGPQVAVVHNGHPAWITRRSGSRGRR